MLCTDVKSSWPSVMMNFRITNGAGCAIFRDSFCMPPLDASSKDIRDLRLTFGLSDWLECVYCGGLAAFNHNFACASRLEFNFVDDFGICESYSEFLRIHACCYPELLSVGIENVGWIESLVEWCGATNFHYLNMIFENTGFWGFGVLGFWRCRRR